jgi:hypothetical protein
MPPLSGHKSVPIDTEEYRRQVDAAFRHTGREWDAVYGISSDLYNITATAVRFTQQGDYANAAAIYEVVARETLSHYLSYHDEDGALGRVVQDCVEGLGACLENEREDEVLRRRPWFAEYQKVRELAMQFGNWETVRQGALTFLEAMQSTSTLVEIALDEGDIERALQLLQATKPHGLESYQWQYDSSLAPEGVLKTAERAEEAYPRASIDLY